MRDVPDPIVHSVQDILSRTAVEVQRCELILRGIETAVAPMIAAHRTEGVGHALQDIDLLGQSLADIATCLFSLTGQIDPDAEVDALRLLATLRLDDLYQRLGGRIAVHLPDEDRIALF